MEKKLVFENQYIEYWLLADKKEIQAIWKRETEIMTDEDYKELVFNSLVVYEVYHPTFFLIDCTYFFFTASPEMQLWIAENFTPKIVALGITKVAIILPKEFYALLSVEQMMEEVKDNNKEVHETKYFDNYTSAQNWFYTTETK